jgi:hypothetical protein
MKATLFLAILLLSPNAFADDSDAVEAAQAEPTVQEQQAYEKFMQEYAEQYSGSQNNMAVCDEDIDDPAPPPSKRSKACIAYDYYWRLKIQTELQQQCAANPSCRQRPGAALY